jgi:hypothetical protein
MADQLVPWSSAPRPLANQRERQVFTIYTSRRTVNNIIREICLSVSKYLVLYVRYTNSLRTSNVSFRRDTPLILRHTLIKLTSAASKPAQAT